ncbi:MAG: DUF3644 domain-containing protein [Alphaproteobacteria bacterium]|nr:DUF3644 domain-containing protein [Alphaproteobacteria bacterium]
MVKKNKEGRLTIEEKAIVKALLAKGIRNQDIQALINIGRSHTINSARITEVKKDISQHSATEEEVEFFKVKKHSFDSRTRLNLYDDEMLIRSREAMILAVHIFNSPNFKFKTENFCVMAIIAWTYLIIEYLIRKKFEIKDNDGKVFDIRKLLQIYGEKQLPLSKVVRANINAIKDYRDAVEHRMMKRTDSTSFVFFQACCLNFDEAIRNFFGENCSLTDELNLALQFGKHTHQQLSTLSKYDIPEHIAALNASFEDNFPEDAENSYKYKFRVVFMLESSTKGNAHYQVISPDSPKAKEIRTVLLKKVPEEIIKEVTKDVISDDKYPFKPGEVCNEIFERTGKKFSKFDHTQAWKQNEARPSKNSTLKDKTNKDYCIYHKAHKDYTYSEKWIIYLIEIVNDPEKLEELRKFKIEK